MPEYRRDAFDPPAPVAEVTIVNPASGVECRGVRMLLDTGADVSIVPRSALSRVGLSVAGNVRYEVAGFGGAPVQLEAVHLKLTFLGYHFEGRFLAFEQECGILGRNVLNAVRILLDRPALAWHEAPPSPRAAGS